MSIGLYAKAIAAAIGAGLSAAITALQDGHIQNLEWVAIASTVIAALGAVWLIPNMSAGIAKYGKAITAGILAAVGSFGTALADGSVIGVEWVIILLALFNGVQVAIYPNARVSDPD